MQHDDATGKHRDTECVLRIEKDLIIEDFEVINYNQAGAFSNQGVLDLARLVFLSTVMAHGGIHWAQVTS
jgi:hypothetical protein